ncbi:class I SAM-dependent rRNA methyltransferase [Algihabitans albus]|uniref:class I SAM-dependent rRNA methyltransferase n=1 Tax=Algihabitans albus TaxID=2164067 RepID=UPI000E5C71C7|nr:class I SAM-dependent rRNA methyltransferase [Algihabitans albus]
MSNRKTAVGRPSLRLKSKAERRLLLGHPWVFSNELEMTAEAKALDLGTLVRLETHDGRALGVASFNRHTLIAARVLARDPEAEIDKVFLLERLERAMRLRERLIDGPYYRLCHAEADGLPGLVIDRFGETVVLQCNTAGMQALETPLIEAIDKLLQPRRLVLRNDSPARTLEGLEQETRVLDGTAGGPPEGPVEVQEYAARFLADPLRGQKTGWFYDQRDNRRWVAQLAPGARVLDAYCYSGGFAIQAALAGAESVTALDRSESALSLVEATAALNKVANRIATRRGDVFRKLAELATAGDSFNLVICDPPAFAKSKKDLPPALRGYRKLTKLAANLVAPGGYLVLCSCSHHVSAEAFAEQCARGLADAERPARILHRASAAPDHPVHPQLPESDYLKCLVFALD